MILNFPKHSMSMIFHRPKQSMSEYVHVFHHPKQSMSEYVHVFPPSQAESSHVFSTFPSWDHIKPNPEVVECLLKTRAFVIKRANPNIAQPSKKPTGQVTWSKFGGPEKAWLETKLRAGW